MTALKIAENKITARCYENMKVGDLIVYSGYSIADKLIQWKTGSPYSHVAIVCDVNDSLRSFDRVLIIEASTSTQLNNFNGQAAVRGAQVHSLTEWIDAYKDQGEIWWLPLSTKLSTDEQARMQAWLSDIFDQQVQYSNLKTLLLGLNLTFGLNLQSPDKSCFFCSELVTRALQIAGVVNSFIDPTQQTPKDVANFSCVDRHSLKSLTSEDVVNFSCVKAQALTPLAL